MIFRQILMFISFTFLFSTKSLGQKELSNPAPTQNQLIKAGSLLIAMDTINQKYAGIFNMKSYGMANALLQAEIPVKWAIRGGKTKTNSTTDIDFTTTVSKIFPDTASNASIAFRSSVFIVDSAWVDVAWPVITSFGNNVNVFKLASNTTIDIRYTLTHKPRIALLNSSGYDTISVQVLQEAGIPANNYTLFTPIGSIFNPNASYSMISDAHIDNRSAAFLNPIVQYLNVNGGNVLMQCNAIGALENHALLMTTGGTDSVTTGFAAQTFYRHDQAISQIHGPLALPNGEYKWWVPKSGSSLRSNAYEVYRGAASARVFMVAAAKMRPNNERGGNLIYLSGHDYYFRSLSNPNIITKMNGRRFYMNTVFIPPYDSIPGIDFRNDLVVFLSGQSGFPVKNEPYQIKVVAGNKGPARAKNVKVNALLPSGLTYVSYTSTAGTYNSTTGIWSMDSLQKERLDTLTLTTLVSSLGNIAMNATLTTTSYEPQQNNNSTQLNLFGFSRPNVLNDTTYFNAATQIEYYTKINDSDEDNGVFGNVRISQGPFRGSANIINSDSVSYTLGPGFSGLDSLQYVSCDDIGLCDSAWLFINIPTPLPVSLLSFSGERLNETIKLNWITSSEKNNDFFDVEKSNDGNKFFKVGRVDGVGNSVNIQKYNFTDIDNRITNLYYRLAQFDIDGTRTTSKIIYLPAQSSKNYSIKLYPNPSNGEELIVTISGMKNNAVLTISDLIGKTIKKEEIVVAEGQSVISLLNLSPILTTGCYLVNVNDGVNSISAKLMIK
jgi:uncharacterized repeat protein (TIGR01451 family)